jgi:hypothetical protein
MPSDVEVFQRCGPRLQMDANTAFDALSDAYSARMLVIRADLNEMLCNTTIIRRGKDDQLTDSLLRCPCDRWR